MKGAKLIWQLFKAVIANLIIPYNLSHHYILCTVLEANFVVLPYLPDYEPGWQTN